MKRTWKIALVAMFAVLVGLGFSRPSFATQGQGVGTLPTAHRNVGWLTPHQTIEFHSGEVTFVIGSTHDAEQDVMAGTPPDQPQTLEAHWKWHGVDMVIKTPRLSNEQTDEGATRWRDRHEQAIGAALARWPPDRE